MSEWREQYDRMKRWREVLATDRGDRERVRDNFFAFAQACYHLVDWLHSDLSQPIRKPEAKSHVRASEALAFCAGICNGSKHAQLEQKDVDLSVTESTVNDYRFYPNEGRKTTTQRVVQVLHLEWQGRQVLALRFAERCIAEWEDLLRARKLLRTDEAEE